ncbi:ABC transporter substrate-binding protein [Demequina litorisediminis]|uniref:Sugar ABC transporter substrate-binding protein n=1 Tax=Demequina litorisediminis TaxID=1849022 RepID=A0ABQ6IAB7_9MICO|nr:extracellular solute-binding protein [Demequina litorisediminis]GMA34808.1 sugar ABC transporter substrate-binding protein [Demequina litorisediminis]
MVNVHKRRRFMAVVALTAASGMALSACSSGSDTDPSASGSTGGEAQAASGEDVTLDFAFWGNDVRADMYEQSIALFEEEYPNITVNSTFLDYPAFWEKRQTEAAGGGLPDVMQFDYSYLRQYSENGLLLDLGPHLGNEIAVDGLSDQILGIGVVNDVTTGIATSTNAWGMYTNPQLLETAGVAEFAGGTWDDYKAWVAEVTEASGGEIFGGTDYTGRIQNFEVQLRAEGRNLFNEDGTPGFDEARLAEFWESGADMRGDGGSGISQQRLEEPVPGLGLRLRADRLRTHVGQLRRWLPWRAWASPTRSLGLVAPPVTVEGAKDLYLKPSMLHTIAASTEHPAESAMLVDFLVNSPEVGAIFGTNRGLPASTTMQEGITFEGLDAQIRDYEASVADRLGDAPPVPLVGYGTLEEKFRVLGTELGFGTLTVDEAVSQFFSEMDVVLGS